MEKQVVSVYAGTSGALDSYPTAAVGAFEKELHRFLEDRKPEILKRLSEEKKLADDLKAALDAAIAEFRQTFRAPGAEDAAKAAAPPTAKPGEAKPAAAAKPAEAKPAAPAKAAEAKAAPAPKPDAAKKDDGKAHGA